ncbi:hypothetical protein JZ751_000825 [Albula glossodonta]|uniref:Uncharacterized protein n=1 Tax=Albula glossodonta TaxID=121402 RepID=A0A8T2PXG6_9TELE|nr:hypothetical protein JZ751_000825 [Albula glossodonta]
MKETTEDWQIETRDLSARWSDPGSLPRVLLNSARDSWRQMRRWGFRHDRSLRGVSTLLLLRRKATTGTRSLNNSLRSSLDMFGWEQEDAVV